MLFLCTFAELWDEFVYQFVKGEMVMDVFLKQTSDGVYVYIDKKIATVFSDKNTNYVSEWIEKNIKYARVYILK